MSVEVIETICAWCGNEMVVPIDYPTASRGNEWVCPPCWDTAPTAEGRGGGGVQ